MMYDHFFSLKAIIILLSSVVWIAYLPAQNRAALEVSGRAYADTYAITLTGSHPSAGSAKSA